LYEQEIILLLANQYVLYTNSWQMQLIFLLAGFSIPHSFLKRDLKSFYIERFSRLLIPLLFGIFFWLSIIGWILVKISCDLYGVCNYPTFFHYYIHWIGHDIEPYYLWFLVYLLPMSLLGGFIYSKKMNEIGKKNYKYQRRPSLLFQPRMLIFLAFLSYILDSIPLNNYVFQNDQVLYFIFGLSLGVNYKKSSNIDAIQKNQYLTISLGIFFLIIQGIIHQYVLYLLFKYLSGWFLSYGIIGFFSKKLNYNTRFLQYFSKAVMPLYIIHLPLQAIVSYYIIPLSFSFWLKLPFLVIINYILSIFLYEIVKRNKIFRSLFGIKS
jgi:hypothetical protein